MSNIPELQHLPEVNFSSSRSLEEIKNEILSDYAAAYRNNAGKVANLSEADPIVMAIGSFALQYYQMEQLIAYERKQNLLQYAEGAALDSLGAIKKVFRSAAVPASTIVEFSMLSVRSEATSIPGGTRLVTEDEIVFVTDEYAEIPAGESSITVSATAETAGISGNGYQPGAIDTMMDPVAYIDTVKNITATSGGKDVQSDDDFTRAIFNAPQAYSVAGPEEAYELKAMESRPDIETVKAYSPDPAHVNIVFMLGGGVIPAAEDLAAMEEYFTPKSMRPLADRVTAEAPSETEYNLTLKYYIRKTDSAIAAVRKTAIMQAIEEYKTWQRQLGRDINPSELIQRVMAAGAKRVELTEPAFVHLEDTQIARLCTETVTYGGIEND